MKSGRQTLRKLKIKSSNTQRQEIEQLEEREETIEEQM